MTTAVAVRNDTSIIEEVIAKGDLKALTADQRAAYYTQVCESMGLNPLSQPFQYIVLNGKLQLYATKGATDQLNRIHGISVRVDNTEIINDVYVVRATGQDATGRQSSDIGAVSVKGLQGDNLANAMMKATTKAKRRVTMSMCGLGMLDETEVDTIPSAQRVPMDPPQIVEVAAKPKAIVEAEVVEESFDERLYQATALTGRAQKEALAPLLAEIVAEEDTDKARKLIVHLPTYAQADSTMTYLFEKHNIHSPEMTEALKARKDAPEGFVDVGSGEIVE
jgi:hypothetical protein